MRFVAPGSAPLVHLFGPEPIVKRLDDPGEVHRVPDSLRLADRLVLRLVTDQPPLLETGQNCADGVRIESCLVGDFVPSEGLVGVSSEEPDDSLARDLGLVGNVRVVVELEVRQ